MDPLDLVKAEDPWAFQKAGGWSPIPGGKHGGERKKEGGHWVYRYPSEMHHAEAVAHHKDRREHWAGKVAEHRRFGVSSQTKRRQAGEQAMHDTQRRIYDHIRPGGKATVEYDEAMEKAGGWSPIPGGKHGGERKKVGGKWQYRYPSMEHARQAASHHTEKFTEARDNEDYDAESHHEEHMQAARSHIAANIMHRDRAKLVAQYAHHRRQADAASDRGSRAGGYAERSEHERASREHGRKMNEAMSHAGFANLGELDRFQRQHAEDIAFYTPHAKPGVQTAPGRATAWHYPTGKPKQSGRAARQEVSDLARRGFEFDHHGPTWVRKAEEHDMEKGGGWSPVPGGKHGGERRRTATGWEYRYASKMDARNAMRHHRSHANKHLNVPGHDSGIEATGMDAYRHHNDAMRGAAAFAESGRPSTADDRKKQRTAASYRKSDPLDLVRGSGGMIATFPGQVGSMRFDAEDTTLAPGFQGGLAKGGEGSRGGRVIGHTASGKPIYAGKAADHEDHKHWSPQDHHDAARVHDRHADAMAAQSWGPPRKDVMTAEKISDDHHEAAKRARGPGLGGGEKEWRAAQAEMHRRGGPKDPWR